MRVGDDEVRAAPDPAERIDFARQTFPVTVAVEADTVAEVVGAVLSPYSSGPLRTLSAPYRWTRGAVYDAAGHLLPTSQRIGGLGGDHVVAADPATLGRRAGRSRAWLRGGQRERHLTGTWLYAGTWMDHFGHFITETLTTLWPTDLDVAGILAHPFIFGSAELDWQLDLLELAGYGSLPRVVAVGGCRVDRLLVPTRPFVPNGYATSMATQTWQRVAGAAVPAETAPAPSSVVYLSRTHWHERAKSLGRPVPRELVNESLLDRLMGSRGYRVVFPEEMGVRDQIAEVRSSSTLIGVSGSALHLSAFARPGTRVIEIGDARSGVRPLPNQRVIDAASGHLTGVVPYGTADAAIDLAHLEAMLDNAGI